MKALHTLLLLLLSNVFMTFAWYGHLYAKKWTWFQQLGLWAVILLSWGLALFEYIFQVPANKIGYEGNGGNFSMFELKIIQEVISLTVFTLIVVYVFKTEKMAWNHLVGFALMALAVFFVFKKF